jgi:hypothetical protein
MVNNQDGRTVREAFRQSSDKSDLVDRHGDGLRNGR